MFVAIRTIRPKLTHLEDAVTLASLTKDRLQNKHRINVSVAVEVGGGTPTIAVAYPCERLGDLEAIRTAFSADKRLHAAMRTATEMATDIQDMIGRVLKALVWTDQRYALVNMVALDLTRMRESVKAALNAAEFFEQRLDRRTSVVSSVTGNRATIGWIALAKSLDEIGHDVAAVERSGAFDRFLDGSNSLFLPGTLRQSIWHIQNPGTAGVDSGRELSSPVGRRVRVRHSWRTRH